jgi:RNA recognition motif-containing protein
LPTTEHDNSAALVEVASEEEAKKAIEGLNGHKTTCEAVSAAGGLAANDTGTVMTVNFAGYDNTPSDNIFINGLPSPKVDEKWLRDYFESLELTITSMKALPDKNGAGFSQALVRVESQEQAETAIALLNGEICPADAAAKPKLVVKYGGDSGEASDSLYIQGLPPPQVDVNSLKEVFAALELTVLRCKAIPDTKGFGASCALLQLASTDEATTAIELMNGEACPADIKADAGSGGNWSGPSKQVQVKYQGENEEPSDSLYISFLPSPGTSPESIKQLIEGIGCTHKRTKIIPDSKGWGYCAALVQVGSQEEAALLMENLAGQTLSNEDMKELAPNAPTHHVQSGVKDGQATLAVRFAGRDNAPSDNLYVTGLPTTADEQLLKNLFGGLHMTVGRAKMIPDTKGFGSCAAMVQLGSLDEATKAIAELHGQSFAVEALSVLQTAEATEQVQAIAAAAAPRSAPAPAAAGNTLVVRYAGNAEAASENLFIGGLPLNATEAILKTLFEALAVNVQRVKVLPDTKKVGSLSAMVKCGDEMEAGQAIEQLNGEVFPEDLCGEAAPEMAPPASITPAKKPVGLQSATQKTWTDTRKNNGAATGMTLAYAGKQQTPSENLYVANLPAPQTTPDVLKSIFEAAGLTVTKMKVNADTKGYGKCTAMVMVASKEEAAQAIELFSGKSLESASEGTSEPPAKKQKVEKNVASAKKVETKKEEAPPMSVRYAGKKVGDGNAPPSDYIVLQGFPAGKLPSEDDVKGILCGFNVTLKRMRSMKDQLMVQVASIAEATKAIENLDQWPWPSMEEEWPEE